MTARTALYWIYDVDGMLLYIGITDEPEVRFAQHAKGSLWWPLAHHHDIQWYGTRQDAESAEIAAIKKHDPYFNRTHAISPPFSPEQEIAIRNLCQQLSLSRPMLVMALLDREIAARGLLGETDRKSILGWPDDIKADEPSEPLAYEDICHLAWREEQSAG